MSKQLPSHVYVQILQNGQLIAEYDRPVNKRGSITLGAKKSANLCVPHYNFKEARKIATIEKKGVQVYAEVGSEGFATTGGVAVHISATDKTSRIINLKDNDTASIGFDDLLVLFKVGPAPAPARKDKRLISSDFRGGVISAALDDLQAAKILGVAFLAAAVCFSGVIYGFAVRGDDRPRHFSELPPEFTLRFIHPMHLRTAPEALQNNLNRADLIGSVTAYYDSTSATLIDAPVGNPNLVFPTTTKTWNDLHHQQANRIDNLMGEAKTEFEAAQNKPNTAMVSIPIHVGESLLNKRHHLLAKYEMLHRALDTNLASKRELIAEFKLDQPYDFADYKNAGAGTSPNMKAQSELAKIKVFRQTTDEEAMYIEANTMAEEAAKLQKTKVLPIKHTLGSELPKVVTIGKDVASYLPLHDLAMLDEKLKELRAGELGHTLIKTHSEPLIGKLDPKLIERVIVKNRFQLQLCFELALRRNRTTTGDMEWMWRVDTKGKISELNLLTSTISDSQMVDCVRKKIAAWQFPRPRDGSVEIRYPFSFSPAKG